MSGVIADVDALQSCIGKTPGPRDLKVIDHIDVHARRWIDASPLAFVAFTDGDGPAVSAAGGAEGFARSSDPLILTLPLEAIDASRGLHSGMPFASLFLVPGMGETLRVNGRVTELADGAVRIRVEECYLHCAKALIRSGFWAAPPIGDAGRPADAEALIGASRFLALATVDAHGHADLSPKGDPPGALLHRRDGAIWCPDRPGNRRVDSFRNILVQPRVAALAMVPGSAHLVRVSGEAQITTDAGMRASFAVDGRESGLVTRIDKVVLQTFFSEAVARARLWPCVGRNHGLDAAEIFRAHVLANRSGGLQARIARASVAVPGLVRKGLDRDYKKNLY